MCGTNFLFMVDEMSRIDGVRPLIAPSAPSSFWRLDGLPAAPATACIERSQLQKPNFRHGRSPGFQRHLATTGNADKADRRDCSPVCGEKAPKYANHLWRRPPEVWPSPRCDRYADDCRDEQGIRWLSAPIPRRLDQNQCVRSQRPIDMILKGWSTSLFQAPQRRSTVLSWDLKIRFDSQLSRMNYPTFSPAGSVPGIWRAARRL